MRFRRFFPAFLSLAMAGGLMAAPAAMAQSAAQQQAAISDQDLKTFAVAARDVQKINQDYVPAYQSAQTDEQRQAIQQEAMGKMAQSVKDKGMSVEKYNQIVSAAQADPEIARQVDNYAKQAQ
jgi:hypothetical protein